MSDQASVVLIGARIQHDSLKANGMINDLRRVVKLNMRIFQKVGNRKQKALLQWNFEPFKLVEIIKICENVSKEEA
jgi:hypothetical protein